MICETYIRERRKRLLPKNMFDIHKKWKFEKTSGLKLNTSGSYDKL